jgi:hypothetical protein
MDCCGEGMCVMAWLKRVRSVSIVVPTSWLKKGLPNGEAVIQ